MMNLRRVREERGWSQETMAGTLRTSREFVSAVERGKRNLPPRRAAVLKAVLEALRPAPAEPRADG
jgi:transcriptional regulator with XRE-family HTH domain